jgi:hypothetical protein
MIPNAAASTPERGSMAPAAPPHSPMPTPNAKKIPATDT